MYCSSNAATHEDATCLVDAAWKFAQHEMEGFDGSHDFAHVQRVYHNALLIADETEKPINRLTVQLGAILHDVEDHKYMEITENRHGKVRAFLRKYEVLESQVEDICRIVEGISFSKQKAKGFQLDESFTELDIVQDADRLDSIGAVGIARCFIFGGARGKSMEVCLDHFDDKLLLLKKLMRTDHGRTLAIRRHQILKEFYDQCRMELRLD